MLRKGFRYMTALGVGGIVVGVTILTRWWTSLPWLAAARWVATDWHWLGILIIITATTLLIRLPNSPADGPTGARKFPESPLLSDRGIAAVAGSIALIGVATIIFLWQEVAPHAPKDGQASLRMDAVKYGLGLMLSGGALAGLLVALRRQHFSEHAHKLTERTQQHTERDAAERRVTEQYTKGVEQIGSDKAAVRLGGLYTLERLAQENPNLQQTVVNVICAYLRMPYPVDFSHLRGSTLTTPPRGLPTVRWEIDGTGKTQVPDEDPQEELQVRLAAQDILIRHQKHDGKDAPNTYWHDIEINLSGSTLVNWVNVDVKFCGPINFRGAKFVGPAFFRGVTFEGPTSFEQCRFTQNVDFHSSKFASYAFFGWCVLAHAYFQEVEFQVADFTGATFDAATFRKVSWKNRAQFERATFREGAIFESLRFTGVVKFTGAKFPKAAMFGHVLFGGETFFSGASFGGTALLDALYFVQKAWFDRVALPANTAFRGCEVARPRNDDRDDEWPAGWKVIFNDSDRVWGALKKIQQPANVQDTE